MSSSIRSLKAPSWVSEFRAFIMRGVANEISGLTPISPLTSTHRAPAEVGQPCEANLCYCDPLDQMEAL